jgi:hypothetical protein
MYGVAGMVQNMITTVRQRLHSMNAEKIAEQNRLEISARVRHVEFDRTIALEFDDVDDSAFYTELPPALTLELFVGDSTDIYDADSDDIASWLAMFYPTFAYD